MNHSCDDGGPDRRIASSKRLATTHENKNTAPAAVPRGQTMMFVDHERGEVFWMRMKGWEEITGQFFDGEYGWGGTA